MGRPIDERSRRIHVSARSNNQPQAQWNGDRGAHGCRHERKEPHRQRFFVPGRLSEIAGRNTRRFNVVLHSVRRIEYGLGHDCLNLRYVAGLPWGEPIGPIAAESGARKKFRDLESAETVVSRIPRDAQSEALSCGRAPKECLPLLLCPFSSSPLLDTEA